MTTIHDISSHHYVKDITVFNTAEFMRACGTRKNFERCTSIHMHPDVYIKQLQLGMIVFSSYFAAGTFMNKAVFVNDDLLRLDDTYETNGFINNELIFTVISREK